MKKIRLIMLSVFILLIMAGCGSIHTYEVIFELNGGTLVSGEVRQTIPEGGAAVPPTVKRDGFVFQGWNESINYITSNKVVVANWEQVSSPDEKPASNGADNALASSETNTAPEQEKNTAPSSGVPVTVSNLGVTLEQPAESEYFTSPARAYAKASSANGSIYIMPKPKDGNGTLGRVSSGSLVSILAQRGGFYFFETEDGQQGWNGTGYFTLIDEIQRPEVYSTVSNKGVALEYPSANEYFSEPLQGTVKASAADGSIFIMPKPQAGNGTLGKVKHGTAVTILAQRGGFYFFQTEDDRMGWNGTGYFNLG